MKFWGPNARSFKNDLKAGKSLMGTFLKIPTSHTIEILGSIGFDFVVIDEEHGPLDRERIDQLILAARASGIAPLVRVSESSASHILGVLDCGAAGILVPHVESAQRAREIARHCKYEGGSRGFSSTTRAGGYGGRSMPELIEDQDRNVVFIAMIEDAAALDQLDDIAQVEGLSGMFMGRADLAVALGERSMQAKAVDEAVERITEAGRRHKVALLATSGGKADAERLHGLGVTAFLLGADVTYIRRSAQAAYAETVSVTGAG